MRKNSTQIKSIDINRLDGETLVELDHHYHIDSVTIEWSKAGKYSYILEYSDWPVRFWKFADTTSEQETRDSRCHRTHLPYVKYIRIRYHLVQGGELPELTGFCFEGEPSVLPAQPVGAEKMGYAAPVIASAFVQDSRRYTLCGDDWLVRMPKDLSGVATKNIVTSSGRRICEYVWESPVNIAEIYLYNAFGHEQPIDDCRIIINDTLDFTIDGIPPDYRARRVNIKEIKTENVKIIYEPQNEADFAQIRFFSEVAPCYWSKELLDEKNWMSASVPKSLKDDHDFDYYGPSPASFDIEMPYRNHIFVPETFIGRRIILKINKAAMFSRIWIDGNLIAIHDVAYSCFDLDITDFVRPGQTHLLAIGLTKCVNTPELPFCQGLLGEVEMVALPQVHVASLCVQGEPKADMRHGNLTINAGVRFCDDTSAADLSFILTDPRGNTVSLDSKPLHCMNPSNLYQLVTVTLEATIDNILLWDAEHPELYTLTAVLTGNDSEMELIKKHFGFRKIEFTGNKMYVNNHEVKLRGMSTFFTFGEEIDIIATIHKQKQANINCIITTHYPLDKAVIDLCDRVGMYVIMEPEGFILGNTPHNSFLKDLADNPYMERQFIHSIAECIETYQSNTSLFMYSIGDEAWFWGENCRKVVEYIKLADPKRKWLFNYDFKIPLPERNHIEISSYHYPIYDQEKWGGLAVPHMYDQYMPITCFQTDALALDQGLRNIYQRSASLHWEKVFESEGALGGTVWNITDDGRGRAWGILDQNGREKPEFWALKKAYSPVCIDEKLRLWPLPDGSLVVPVKNRFDSTNFNEIEIEWKIGNGSGNCMAPDILPHFSGIIKIPCVDAKQGDVLKLKFLKNDSYVKEQMIDCYEFVIGGPIQYLFPKKHEMNGLSLKNTLNTTEIEGNDFKLVFDHSTGLILRGEKNGQLLIEGGPFLNLGAYQLKDWCLDTLDFLQDNDRITVNVFGCYAEIQCEFKLTVYGDGIIDTQYRISNPPAYFDAVHNVSGYNECGIAYIVSEATEYMRWESDPYFSFYPEKHIGRRAGIAYKNPKTGCGTWENDTTNPSRHNPEYVSAATVDFSSAKWNVYYAQLHFSGQSEFLQFEGDSMNSVRACAIRDTGKIRWNLNNQWGVPADHQICVGEPGRDMNIPPVYTGKIKLRLASTINEPVRCCDLLAGIRSKQEHETFGAITYDLGKPCQLSRITVDGGMDYYIRYRMKDQQNTGIFCSGNSVVYPDHSGYLRNYSVEVSVDNIRFATLLREMNGTGELMSYDVDSIHCRYMRLIPLASDTCASGASDLIIKKGVYEIENERLIFKNGACATVHFNANYISWNGEGCVGISIDGCAGGTAVNKYKSPFMQRGNHTLSVTAAEDQVTTISFCCSFCERINAYNSALKCSMHTAEAVATGDHDLYDDWGIINWDAGYDKQFGRFTYNNGVTAELNFVGCAIQWYGTLCVDGGTANIYIDGAYISSASQYAEEKQYGALVFEIGDLEECTHTLKIVTISNMRVDIDYFEITTTPKCDYVADLAVYSF